MANKSETAVIAIAIVALVAVAGVLFYHHFAVDDNVADDRDTYYFYLDGMGDINGWHEGKGNDVMTAFDDALSSDNISYTMGSYGMISSIGDYTPVGNTNFSVFEYTLTTVASPWNGYFFEGPVIEDVTSNIVYISYTEWSYDYASGTTSYTLDPSNTTAPVLTTGPFAEGSGYTPLTYGNTYWFYFDGFNDSAKGWYSATGDAATALVSAASQAGLTCSVSDSGWITFDNYPAVSNYGVAVFGYFSEVGENAWSGYFFNGPVLTSAATNVFYISYGTYTMDADWNVTYDVTPDTVTDIVSTGPFATA